MRATTLVLLFVLLAVSAREGTSQDSIQPQGHKSEATAWALAIGATAIPFLGMITSDSEVAAGIGGVMFFVGPSAGLFYTKAYRRGLIGIGIRVAVVAVGAVALGNAFSGDDSSAGALALIATGGLLFSYIADFGSITPAVRKYNEGLTAAPIVGADGRFGLRLSVPWPKRR